VACIDANWHAMGSETVHLQGVPIAVNHMDGSRGKVLASSLKYKDTITATK
jgi:uncharacterized Zn-binding protein involved in type VI secretion